MAHMIPPVPKEYDENSDEGRVFEALKTLSDDYYVFHSVSVSVIDKGTLYEREIDFVIAHREKGLLCIEAKNMDGVYFQGRNWYRANGELMSHGGPYHQVQTAMRALRDKYENHPNEDVRNLYSKIRFRKAVFFVKMTEYEFDKLERSGLPEDANRGNTMLASDLLNPEKKINEIFEYKESFEKYGSQKTALTEKEFKLSLNSVLCPEFRILPSPAEKQNALAFNMIQLLREQYKLLDFLVEQDTAVINGAAGTGKTMIAVEKARRNSVDGEKVLFLCYNRLLCDKLNADYKENHDEYYRKQFSNIDFLTISELTKKITGKFDNYDGLLEWLIDCEGNPEKLGYRHVIIDEGQDFGLIDLSLGDNKEAHQNCSLIDTLQEVVLSCNGTFFLFYDKYQTIQGGTDVKYELPDCIQNSDCRLTLKVNCRNTKEIAKTSVTPLKNHKNKAIKPTTACSWFRPTKPTLHFCDDRDDNIMVLESILDDLIDTDHLEDIVILTTDTIEYTSIYDRLVTNGKGYNVQYYYPYRGKKYLVSTCKKFKGLEADSIILIDLTEKSFEGKKGMEFYVGASRAKLRLDFICNVEDGDVGDLVKEIDPNAPQKPDTLFMKKILAKTFAADMD